MCSHFIRPINKERESERKILLTCVRAFKGYGKGRRRDALLLKSLLLKVPSTLPFLPSKIVFHPIFLYFSTDFGNYFTRMFLFVMPMEILQGFCKIFSLFMAYLRFSHFGPQKKS